MKEPERSDGSVPLEVLVALNNRDERSESKLRSDVSTDRGSLSAKWLTVGTFQLLSRDRATVQDSLTDHR